MRTPIPIGILLATVILAACSGSATSPTAAPSGAPGAEPSAAGTGSPTAAVIKNFAFSPAQLTVKVGTTVTWTNEDGAPHTVTFDSGSDASGTLGQGAAYSATFSAAGTFAYHCAIHPRMKATVTVTP